MEIRVVNGTSHAASAAKNEPYLLLLAFLKMEMRERRRDGKERSESTADADLRARTGLHRAQQEILAKAVFGRESISANRSESQNRLLKSWMEMGYPPTGERP